MKVSVHQVRSAREAWQAMAGLVLDNQRRREVSEQTGMSFGTMRALRRIAGRPMPMRELAGLLGMEPPGQARGGHPQGCGTGATGGEDPRPATRRPVGSTGR
jgi:hypothetical protein